MTRHSRGADLTTAHCPTHGCAAGVHVCPTHGHDFCTLCLEILDRPTTWHSLHILDYRTDQQLVLCPAADIITRYHYDQQGYARCDHCGRMIGLAADITSRSTRDPISDRITQTCARLAATRQDH